MAELTRDIALDLRNRQWHNNELVPAWVDPTEVDLDRFFTKPEVARFCHDSLASVMLDDHAEVQDYYFVDAGAGMGAFYDLLPVERRIGIDLIPTRPDFIQEDYLSWQPIVNGRSYAVIGNPPFGYRGWLALSFLNHSATFANYIGFILPMGFQSEGKGSPKHRVMGAELVLSENLPLNSFENEAGTTVKLNALWQVWKRGVNNRKPVSTCNDWIDIFTVDTRKERLCGQERLHEATWFLQRTFYGKPPMLVSDFHDVKYGCGYGIVIKKQKAKVTRALRETDWLKFSNLAMHHCNHISMYHIRNALIEAGFNDS